MRPPHGLVVLLLFAVVTFGLLATVGTASAATVAAGNAQSCATKPDGSVWCWGTNWYGLGDGTTTDSAVPVRVQGISSATDVAVGNAHACARQADRTVWCWGDNGSGALGDGTNTDATTPVRVQNLDDAVAITAGAEHTCAVRATGQVLCWGENDSGRLGDGTTDDALTPAGVSGLTGARSVTAGQEHTCAVLTAGTVQCWGENQDGQLGDGTTDDSLIPVAVSNLTGAVAVAVGEDHSCAVRTGGAVSCWGSNGSGQLGDGTTDRRLAPTPVTPAISGVVSLSLGSSVSCAVLGDGSTRCWGYNGDGELGPGTTASTSVVPIAVTGAAGATEVAAGSNHICLRGSSSAVQCWGNGTEGQLGNGKTVDAADPAMVIGLNGATTIAVGDEFTCAVRSGGTINCWGRNRYGQLGAGLTHPLATNPVPVAGITNTTALAAGGIHACALHGAGAETDRQISCWGSDWIGQLGTGGVQPRIEKNLAPVATDVATIFASYPNADTFRFTTVSAGNTFTCALVVNADNANGDVWCWGRGGAGQLGEGQTTDRFAPVKVARPAGFSPVALQNQGPTLVAGRDHICAVSSSGNRSVWCWGENSSGQIGDGQTTDRTQPKQVAGLSGVASLASGDAHTCALRTNGTVACWGRGSQGQLGHGQTPGTSVPVEVASINGATALTAGGGQTCATLANGTLSCWGVRFDGRFSGGQNAADRSTPIAMAGMSGVRAVALGGTHGCAATTAGTTQCWGSGQYGQLGDGPMPGGHYPIQRAPTYVIGFLPPPPPVDTTPPPVVTPIPEGPPAPAAPRPARPQPLTVELRDGKLSLRGVALKRAAKVKTCPKTAKATISARVAVRLRGRSTTRTVKTTRTLKVKSTKTACHTTAAFRLPRQLAGAKKVTLSITGKGLRTSKRTVTARTTARLQATAVRLDRLVVRSTRPDVCPARATVTVTGATKATKKRKATERNVFVRFAPTANCELTTTVKLTKALRRVKAVTVTVSAPGLRATRRTVKVG